MRDYHDTEWGTRVHGSPPTSSGSRSRHQSGLSWSTILNKREAFREAFAGFDADAVAAYDESDALRLMADPRIVRNRRKIDATLINARATVALREDGGLEEFVRLPAGPAAGPDDDRPGDDVTGVDRALEGVEEAGIRSWGPPRCSRCWRRSGLRPPPRRLPSGGDNRRVTNPRPFRPAAAPSASPPDRPGQPRPRSTQGMSMGSVQRWVMSVLAVTTIGHFAAGLVFAAVLHGQPTHERADRHRPDAGVVGVLGVAAGFLIHQKSALTPWLLVGLIPAGGALLHPLIRSAAQTVMATLPRPARRRGGASPRGLLQRVRRWIIGVRVPASRSPASRSRSLARCRATKLVSR